MIITALKASNILYVQGRSIIFLTKGVEVTNKFVLPNLYQYLGNFDQILSPQEELEVYEFQMP